jgi:DNA-binding Lrp family transcriptional regulator
MVKSRRETLIKDEQKVLEILQSNAKMNIDTIAKKCKFSRQKVWRIIKKVEKEKAIWGYSAILNDDSIEMEHYILLFKRTTKSVDKNMVNEIAFEKLEDVFQELHMRIENITYVHGKYDGVISFWTDDLISAKKFVNQFSIHMQGLIEEIELLETIFPIRRQTIKNPHIAMLSDFL